MEFLMTMMEDAVKRNENVALVHGYLKKLTGQDLPPVPEVWREWARVHSEGMRIDESQFREMLSELGMGDFTSDPYGGIKPRPDRDRPFSDS
jgi:hypothetical protein